MGGKLFNQVFTPNSLQPGQAPARAIADYNQALLLRPAPAVMAMAIYARGLAQRAAGDTAAGDADAPPVAVLASAPD